MHSWGKKKVHGRFWVWLFAIKVSLRLFYCPTYYQCSSSERHGCISWLQVYTRHTWWALNLQDWNSFTAISCLDLSKISHSSKSRSHFWSLSDFVQYFLLREDRQWNDWSFLIGINYCDTRQTGPRKEWILLLLWEAVRTFWMRKSSHLMISIRHLTTSQNN